MKPYMYKNVIKILELVSLGKNLNEIFIEYKNNPDIAKIKNIIYGVLRYIYTIDYVINKIVSKKNDSLLNILRVGIFELWLSYKPDYAVINDLVNLTKDKINNQSVANFVNATLRNFQKNKEILFLDIDKDYSVKYNLPNWMINKLKKQYKGNYLPILEAFSLHPSFGIRVNNSKITNNDYITLLEYETILYKEISGKIILNQAMNINDIPGFEDGLVSIQDIAAQYLVDILNKYSITPKKVLDACSAPGGKTCQLLENYDCNLTALDVDQYRLKRVQDNLERLKLKAKIVCGNAALNNWNKDNSLYDLIVADVPCSATGTIKRNPDIKITRKEKDIDNFVEIQRKIVTNLWNLLEPNGYMVYITCSIFQEENSMNISWFKESIKYFDVVDELHVLPSEYNDGLYYCLICKR